MSCFVYTNLLSESISKFVPRISLELLQRSGVQLSESLASLGIMEAQFRVLLKPLGYHRNIVSEGLRGVINSTLIMPMEFFFRFSSLNELHQNRKKCCRWKMIEIIGSYRRRKQLPQSLLYKFTRYENVIPERAF